MAGEKILVVEDEPLVAQMLADYLATLSVEVLHASNGVEALELAWEQEPDLILLDVMMPRLDGFEVAGILKQNPKTRHIPIIFLTALTKVEDKVRGLELEADDYITKPFQPEELLARVMGVLRRVRAEREPTGVRGNLQAMSLPNLIQLLEMERRSGVLVLSRGRERGHLSLKDGRIEGATLGRFKGEIAVYRLLDWEEGEFQLEPSAAPLPPEVKVHLPNQELILEWARRKDELDRLKGKLPPFSARLRVSPKLHALLQGRPLSPDLERFLNLFDGTRDIGQILEVSGLDELKALQDIARLLDKGILESI